MSNQPNTGWILCLLFSWVTLLGSSLSWCTMGNIFLFRFDLVSKFSCDSLYTHLLHSPRIYSILNSELIFSLLLVTWFWRLGRSIDCSAINDNKLSARYLFHRSPICINNVLGPLTPTNSKDSSIFIYQQGKLYLTWILIQCNVMLGLLHFFCLKWSYLLRKVSWKGKVSKQSFIERIFWSLSQFLFHADGPRIYRNISHKTRQIIQDFYGQHSYISIISACPPCHS